MQQTNIIKYDCKVVPFHLNVDKAQPLLAHPRHCSVKDFLLLPHHHIMSLQCTYNHNENTKRIRKSIIAGTRNFLVTYESRKFSFTGKCIKDPTELQLQ